MLLAQKSPRFRKLLSTIQDETEIVVAEASMMVVKELTRILAWLLPSRMPMAINSTFTVQPTKPFGNAFTSPKIGMLQTGLASPFTLASVTLNLLGESYLSELIPVYQCMYRSKQKPAGHWSRMFMACCAWYRTGDFKFFAQNVVSECLSK